MGAMMSRLSTLPLWLALTMLSSGCVSRAPILLQSHEHGLASREVERIDKYALRDADGRWRLRRAPRQCMPYAPPIRAMNREKVYEINGVVEWRVAADGHVAFIQVRGIIPESVASDVESWFREAFAAAPCSVDERVQPTTLETPFRMVLQN